MYISKLTIQNWRSYKDVTFNFKKPVAGKPIVLIGAMNGAGKTSFLMALYLGMFGRFGLRFVENHKSFSSTDEKLYYRSAIEKFRRRNSEYIEPTLIDITFSPTEKEIKLKSPEIRIRRYWHFNTQGKLRQSTNFEEVTVYVNGKPLIKPDLEKSEDKQQIEKYLFKNDVIPAFFFDGEQAQSIIDAAGNSIVKQAVDVLFGTNTIRNSIDRVESYMAKLNEQTGGKKAFDERKTIHQKNVHELVRLNTEIQKKDSEEKELQTQRTEILKKIEDIEKKIVQYGGDNKARLEEINNELKDKKLLVSKNKNFIVEELTTLSLEMALAKFRDQIISQLEKEAELEKWDILRENQESKIETVLTQIFKQPHLHDPLLCTLDIETWEKLRIRVKNVLEQQVNPSPANCADSYLLVFASKNERLSLIEKIQKSHESVSFIPKFCTDIFTVNQDVRELEQEKNLLQSSNPNITDILEELKSLNVRNSDLELKYNNIVLELNELTNKRDGVKNEISTYESFIDQTKNSRTRIALASSIDNVLSDWEKELKPLVLNNLEKITTKKFIEIADKRFSGGKIIMENSNKSDAKPVFINKNNEVELFESMSGFERRSFGISYSLALTELTNYRAPLVIDTPLGNADSVYRQKLLMALSKANLDQIIILTHDEEITEDLHNIVLSQRINDDDGTYFLVKYDPNENQSIVCPNEFFF